MDRLAKNAHDDRGILNGVMLKLTEKIDALRDDMTTGMALLTEQWSKQAAATAVEIARLQMKAGIWGLMAGLLPSVGVFIWWLATRK